MKTDPAITKHEKELHEIFAAAGLDETRGLALMRTMIGTAHLVEVLADNHLQAKGLSMSRMRLLVWLYVEEQRGNKEGVSPSHLSHYQHISKNTVSALLGSLEEQGLIERTLSSEDKRSFKICLTKAGRDLMRSTLPAHNSSMTQVFGVLTIEEQKTLLKILSKLRQSLIEQIGKIDLSSYKTSVE
ncbi:MAG: MarR family transcriptional regulator [Chloroflexi bacterium]|nr:MarR family transcriptional regulator [Chloroflexota bacterium]